MELLLIHLVHVHWMAWSLQQGIEITIHGMAIVLLSMKILGIGEDGGTIIAPTYVPIMGTTTD